MRVSISIRALVVVLVVIIVGVATWVLVDRLVVTDAKRIDRMLGEMAKAAERRDVDYVVDKCLDADFKFGRMDREGTRKWGKDVLQSFEIRTFNKYSTEIEVKGDSAHATMRTFVSGGRVPGDQRVDWDIELARRDGDNWRIMSVRVFVFVMGVRRELDPEDVMRYRSVM